MKLVIIESPYAGDVPRNLAYLDACIRDCIERGESPYASHKMLTTVLDDTDPVQRDAGIAAGLCWRRVADYIAIYTDLGWSAGMRAAFDLYEREGLLWETRALGGRWAL